MVDALPVLEITELYTSDPSTDKALIYKDENEDFHVIYREGLGLIFNDANAADANAETIQSLLTGGAVVIPRPETNLDLWCSPLTIDSNYPVIVDFSDIRIRYNLAEDETWLVGENVEKHVVRNLWFKGNDSGFVVNPRSKWSCERIYGQDVQATILVTDDKTTFDRIAGKDNISVFQVGPTENHAGGQKVYNCRADTCESFIEIHPDARMESWTIMDSIISQCDWAVRRQGANDNNPPFLVDCLFLNTGAEYLHEGTFYDPNGRITNCVFILQGAGMQGNAPAVPPEVSGVVKCTEINSAWGVSPAEEVSAMRSSDSAPIISSVVLAADNQLEVELQAFTQYMVRLMLIISSSPTADFRFQLTGPTGAIGTFQTIGANPNATVDIGVDSGSIGTGATTIVNVEGFIITDTDEGDLVLSWAQGTSTAFNTKLLKGSYLRAVPIP